jgi:hypothetical protein
MPLTKSFKQSVQERIRRDPEFAQVLQQEYRETAARSVLDFIKTLPQQEQDAIEDYTRLLCKEAGLPYEENVTSLD